MSLSEEKQQVNVFVIADYFNQLHANVPFLYRLKMSENYRFSGIFRVYSNEILVRQVNCHTYSISSIQHQGISGSNFQIFICISCFTESTYFLGIKRERQLP